MPRSTKENAELREARRRHILDAALRVFAAKGLARAKVADIAREANFSHGLLYHYFAGKEAVFEALVAEVMERVDADLAPTTERAIDRITASITRRCEMLDGIDPVRVVMHAVFQGEVGTPELHARLSKHMVRLRRRLRDLIARAQREGDIDPNIDADEIGRLLMFLFRGLSIDVPHHPLPRPAAETILHLLAPGRRGAARWAAQTTTRSRRTGT